MKRVLISGYYGFANTGDEAVLSSIVDSLRSCGENLEITVFSANPSETALRHNVRAVPRRHLSAVVREIFRTDLLISGGGGLLQDVTSSRSLYYYLGIVALAKLFKKKVVFMANGIGPIRRNFNRFLTRLVAGRADLITVRDEGSKKELENLGVKRPFIQVTADPALLLNPASKDRAAEIFVQEGIVRAENKPLIGFSVRRWGRDEDVLHLLAQAADYVQEVYGAQAVFFPMQYPADVQVSEQVSKRMKEPAPVIRGRYDVDEILSLISKLDVMVGMRLHSLIFAAVSRVPMLGLIYDPKVRNFLRLTGQPEAGNLAELSWEQMQESLDRVWAQRRVLQQLLDERVPVLQAKARENMALLKQTWKY